MHMGTYIRGEGASSKLYFNEKTPFGRFGIIVGDFEKIRFGMPESQHKFWIWSNHLTISGKTVKSD